MFQKYHNKKTVIDGITFDSAKEAYRYRQLCRKYGPDNIQLQVPYVLIPAQKDENGKVIERKCTYIADFVYHDKDGNLIVEDTKGYRTPEYNIKRKLMLYVHGIRISEV